MPDASGLFWQNEAKLGGKYQLHSDPLAVEGNLTAGWCRAAGASHHARRNSRVFYAKARLGDPFWAERSQMTWAPLPAHKRLSAEQNRPIRILHESLGTAPENKLARATPISCHYHETGSGQRALAGVVPSRSNW